MMLLFSRGKISESGGGGFEKTDRIHFDFSIIDGVGRRMKRIFPGRVNIFMAFSAFAAKREANKVFLAPFNNLPTISP